MGESVSALIMGPESWVRIPETANILL